MKVVSLGKGLLRIGSLNRDLLFEPSSHRRLYCTVSIKNNRNVVMKFNYHYFYLFRRTLDKMLRSP